MFTTSRRGFTLIELMVVVAILAALAAIAGVGYGKYQRRARVSAAESMLQDIRSKQELYRNFNRRYATGSAWCPASTPTGSPVNWVCADTVYGILGMQMPVSTYFQYRVVAGRGAGTCANIGLSTDPCSAFDGSGDWWYAAGRADLDGDGTNTEVILTSRSNGLVFKANE